MFNKKIKLFTQNISNGKIRLTLNSENIVNGEEILTAYADITISSSSPAIGKPFNVYYERPTKVRTLIDNLVIEKSQFVVDCTDELLDMIDSPNSGKAIVIESETATQYFGSDTISVFVNYNYDIKQSAREGQVIKSYDIDGKGSLSVNVHTGEYEVTHNDLEVNNGVNSFAICHSYNPKSDKAWRHNFDQTLEYKFISTNNATTGEVDSLKKYILNDGSGKKHVFEERYYYLLNSKKSSVGAEKISTDEFGNLTFEGKEIKKQLTSNDDSLVLHNDLTEFKNLHLIEQEMEEIARLKNAIIEYESNLSQINKSLEMNDRLSTLMTKGNAIENERQSISEAMLELQKESNSNESKLSEMRVSHVDAIALSAQRSANSNSGKIEFSEAATNSAIGAWNEAIANMMKNGSNPNSSLYNYPGTLNMSDTINVKTAVLNPLIATNIVANATFQNDKITVENELLNANKTKFTKELEKRKAQLKTLESQAPKMHVENSDGVIFSYAKTEVDNIFRLSVISDKSQNAIYVKYDLAKDRIDCIVSEKNEGATFSYYDDGKLQSIADCNGNRVAYEYIGNNIKRITKNEQNKTTFAYTGSTALAITTENGRGYVFEFGTDSVKNAKFVKATDVTLYTKISGKEKIKVAQSVETVAIEGIPYQKGDKTNIYVYDIKYSEIEDKYTKLTYLFDNRGLVQSAYERKKLDEGYSEQPSVINNSYVGDKKSYSVQKLDYAKNYLENVQYSVSSTASFAAGYIGDTVCESGLFSGAEYYTQDTVFSLSQKLNASNMVYCVVPTVAITEINAKKITDLVLGGWACADSAYVDRRFTDFSDNGKNEIGVKMNEDFNAKLDVRRKARRFELRAEITYTGNVVVSSYCSYDWMYTDWQYCSVPVSIDGTKTVTGIKVYFDYTYNTNTANFKCFDLREGKWEYNEYDKDKKLIYKEQSHPYIETNYAYDDKKLMSETSKDKTGIAKTTRYEYNDKSMLKRVVDGNGMVQESEFDEKGIAVKTVQYHILDSGKKIYSSEVYDEKGEQIGAMNEFGEQVYTYKNDKKSGQRCSTTDSVGNVTGYGYNADGDITSISGHDGEETNDNNLEYTLGYVTKVSHNRTPIEYEYDGFGEVKGIKIADAQYMSVTKVNNVETKTLANGEKYESVYDNQEKLLEVNKISGSTKTLLVKNIYDDMDKLTCVKDYTTGAEVVYGRYLDKYGRETKSEYTIGGVKISSEQTFDSYEKVTKDVEKIGADTRNYTYAYESGVDGKLKTLTMPNGQISTYETDKLDRITEIKSGTKLVKNINYLQKGDHASGLVSSEWFGTNGKMVDSLKYVYDKEGNITAVKENGEEVTTYKYDGLNRLVREDNKNLNKSYCFRYDMGGNIVERVEVPYTKAEEICGTKYTYTYGTNGWRDQLQSYNGQAIIYNSMGNPTNYRGQAAEWSYGRQLTKLGTTTYKYSSGGNRTEKKVGSETTKYYYTGSKLIAQDNGTAKLYFNYGVEGINSFTYKVGSVAKEYTYKKNILGDILGIYDSVGVEIIKYTYDAWGNHILKVLENGKYIDIASNVVYNASESEVRKVAKLNPFRYRGYYFDLETGLFYTPGRYYDPEIGRWINADDVAYLDPETIGGLNLYSYCGNNPVMNIDPDGHAFFSILIGLGIAALIGATVGAIAYTASEIISYGITGGKGSWSWGMFAGSVLGGAAGGMASMIPGVGPMIAAFVTGVASSSIGMGMQNAFGEANHSWKDILITSAVVGIVSIATAGILKAIPIQGFNAGRGSLQQVTRQIGTKFMRSQITRVAGKTFGKMLAYNLAYSSLGSFANGFIDAWQNYYNRTQITHPKGSTWLIPG